MPLQEKELSPDEQLLGNALRMDHELARGIVFESLATGQKREDENLAFAHIYNCIEKECGEFWQEMLGEYPDEKSRGKLREHEHLAKIMEESRDRMFPSLNPLWGQRN